MTHLAGVRARPAGDAPVHGKPAGDPGSRLQECERPAVRLSDRRGYEVVREDGRRRPLGREELDERRVPQGQIRGVADDAALGVDEPCDREAPGVGAGLTVDSAELTNEAVEVVRHGFVPLLFDAAFVDEAALDRAPADVDREERASGQA